MKKHNIRNGYGGREFTAIYNNGKQHSFAMHNEASLHDALRFARIWNSLADGNDHISAVLNRNETVSKHKANSFNGV